jgi:hypothetical protein
MNFFLNNPNPPTPLSDDELEQMALDNLAAIKRKAVKASKKSCGCCPVDDGPEICPDDSGR